MSDVGWPDVEAAFRGLFSREWYTNHGPLAQQLEAALGDALGVGHAVCVATPGIALTMALEVWERPGAVRVFGPVHPDLACALAWAGMSVSPPDAPAELAICVGIDEEALLRGRAFAQGAGVPLVLDASVGVDHDGAAGLAASLAACRTPALAVIGLRGGPLDAHGGACIALDDDEAAERLRNIRSSYGVRSPRPVIKTANGRLSEAQAAFGLLSLARRRGGAG
jgi:dTDP-4-amino-4,6-dideoxygalactose transaminase